MDQETWDEMISQSFNASLIHFRSYMDYHQDRFHDDSVMIYLDTQLVAVFPATSSDYKVISHSGLTFGGLIFCQVLEVQYILRIFDALKKHYELKGITRIKITGAPEFYWTSKIAFDNFQIAAKKASFNECDDKIYHTLSLPTKIQDRGKRWGIKLAQANNLNMRLSNDYKGFWENLLIPNLQDRHNAKPTHSLEEIVLLANRFPSNIELHVVYRDEEMMAGAVTYAHGQVIHVQYTASSPVGRKFRAVDLLYQDIIQQASSNFKFLSMGISTDPKTGQANKGLVKWKESWGAVGYCSKAWYIDI